MISTLKGACSTPATQDTICAGKTLAKELILSSILAHIWQTIEAIEGPRRSALRGADGVSKRLQDSRGVIL